MNIFSDQGGNVQDPFLIEERLQDVMAAGDTYSGASVVSTNADTKRLVLLAHYVDTSNNGIALSPHSIFQEIEIHPIGGPIIVYAQVAAGPEQDTFLDGASSYTITQGTRFRSVAGHWSRIT